MNNPDNIFTLLFPEVKSIIVSGDIHGWHSAIGDILFKMLDFMEFYEIR